jgi:hypothetical protein
VLVDLLKKIEIFIYYMLLLKKNSKLI